MGHAIKFLALKEATLIFWKIDLVFTSITELHCDVTHKDA